MAARKGVKHGWFVPGHAIGSSYYKTPRNGIVEVSHVGDQKTDYDPYPHIARHYVGEVTEWVAPGAKMTVPIVIAHPEPQRLMGGVPRW